jgi:NADH:ubiquinone oxidoreductase subunit F (NADH-binding)
MTLVQRPAPTVPPGARPCLLPTSGGPSLAAHLGRLGPLPPVGPELIAAVGAAGLRGRGGAGYPTGRKLAAVAAGTGPRVVVGNGTEGEPLSGKDAALLTANPHGVLDGLVAAAASVGAERAILCVKRGRGALVAGLAEAVADRRDPLTVEIMETPTPYVAGQETALLHWLDGGDARPRSGPRPSVRGVDGRPTLVDNVETLAQIGLIARFGPAWYRQVGTPDQPGSMLVTVAGGVERPGVHEIPIGLPLGRLLDRAGAAAASGYLVGGYFGRWIDPATPGTTPLSDAGLAATGARLGAGLIAVVPADSCVLSEVAAVTAWYAANSAGQCGACLFGLTDIARAVRGLLTGEPGAEAAARRWTAMVRGRGACQFPDGAATFVDSALDVLAGEVAAHRAGGCGRPYRGHLPTPGPGAWR